MYVNGIIGEGEMEARARDEQPLTGLCVWYAGCFQVAFLLSIMALCCRDMVGKVNSLHSVNSRPHPLLPPTAPPSPPHFTPVKMEHAEQLELGYMPLRDDFEKEHDNSAESLISGLTVGVEEEELEKALKLAHVDMYSRRLKERERRKR